MNEPNVEELLQAAEEVADAVGDITLRYFRGGLAVESKDDESPVTIADRETERAMRAAISERFPDHGILGEEYGAEGLERPIVWILDPIDGTKSFIAGAPHFGTLIGVLHQGRPLAGVIRMPQLGESFTGAVGPGSRLNGTPIQCCPGIALDQAFLCYNDLPQLISREPDKAQRLLTLGRYQRPTSDCYPYAQLAAGWVDAVVDIGLQPYDYLPLVGVIEGAGGIITDWQGEALGLQSDGRVVAAANPDMHAALLEILAA